MKRESTIGKLQSEATETQHYHRQSSVGTISESLQEREADRTRERQSKKDHVYAISDDQGNLLEHYRYTAFGESEIYSPQTQNKLAGSAIANPVLWNSRRYDEQTDLYYYKYRHYKADIGRWLGRDPIGESGGVNLYGFVGNEPITDWDSLGLLGPIIKTVVVSLVKQYFKEKIIKFYRNTTMNGLVEAVAFDAEEGNTLSKPNFWYQTEFDYETYKEHLGKKIEWKGLKDHIVDALVGHFKGKISDKILKHAIAKKALPDWLDPTSRAGKYLVGHGKAAFTQAASDHLADLLEKDSKNVKKRSEKYILTLIGGVVNNERCRLNAVLRYQADLEFDALQELVTITHVINERTYVGRSLGENNSKHPGLGQKNRVRHGPIESAYELK